MAATRHASYPSIPVVFRPFLQAAGATRAAALTPARFISRVVCPAMRRVAAVYNGPLQASADGASPSAGRFDLDEMIAAALVVPSESTPLRYRLDHLFHPDTHVRRHGGTRMVEFNWTLDFLLLAHAGLRSPRSSPSASAREVAEAGTRYLVQYIGHMRYHQEAQGITASSAHEIGGTPRLVSDFAADFGGRIFLLVAYGRPVAADHGEYDSAVATFLAATNCCDVWRLRQELRGPQTDEERSWRLCRSLAGRLSEGLIANGLAAPVEVYLQGSRQRREGVARINDVLVPLGRVPVADSQPREKRHQLVAGLVPVAIERYRRLLMCNRSLRSIAKARVESLVEMWGPH